MIRTQKNKGFCFIGKFSDLIIMLNNINDRDMKLVNYLNIINKHFMN